MKSEYQDMIKCHLIDNDVRHIGGVFLWRFFFFIFWFVCFVFCALTCTHTQAQRRYQTVWNGDGRGVRGEQRVLMPGCFYENNLWCLATSKQFPFAGVWPKRGELRASTHKVSGMEYLKPPHTRCLAARGWCGGESTWLCWQSAATRIRRASAKKKKNNLYWRLQPYCWSFSSAYSRVYVS